MADTSHLIKVLKKGHHNVMLNQEEWERMYTWIDLNIPYPGSWGESHKPPQKDQVERRVKYFKSYAGILDDSEVPLPMPDPVEYEKPAPAQKRNPDPTVSGFPFDTATAKQMQAQCSLKPKTLDLGDNVKIELAPIPAGNYVMGASAKFMDELAKTASVKKPFYMSRTEVTLAQYNQFKREHENGFIERRGKDRKSRGIFDMNQPNLPVVRISRNEAEAFCEWLSKKSGMKVSLPTETQWEWAARAGSGGSNYLPESQQSKGYNIADEHTGKRALRWNYGRIQKGHKDDELWVADAKSFTPNVWGLYNMLGNVAEWTASDYRPVPGVGVTPAVEGKIDYAVVRGGSWNDTAALASLPTRWRYMPSQPVYDVGFRVVVEK